MCGREFLADEPSLACYCSDECRQLCNKESLQHFKQLMKQRLRKIAQRAPALRRGAPSERVYTPEQPQIGIYFIQAVDSGRIKIGYSRNILSRLKRFQEHSPENLKLLATVEGGPSTEGTIHAAFEHLRLHGEWFKPGADLLSYIDKLGESKSDT
jgi:hypothetical protein